MIEYFVTPYPGSEQNAVLALLQADMSAADARTDRIRTSQSTLAAISDIVGLMTVAKGRFLGRPSEDITTFLTFSQSLYLVERGSRQHCQAAGREISASDWTALFTPSQKIGLKQHL